jgi:hypothetical protein
MDAILLSMPKRTGRRGRSGLVDRDSDISNCYIPAWGRGILVVDVEVWIERRREIP